MQDKAAGSRAEVPAPAPSERKARTPLRGAGLGHIAYKAYCAAVGGVSVGGDALPTWDVLVKDKPDVAGAWCASAQAVISATWEGKQKP
jgi:hypothetical protein